MKSKVRVAVMGGARTPFVKAGTVFRNYSALDLGVHAVNGLLEKQDREPDSIDKLVFGITVLDPRIPQLAREIVFSSRLSSLVRALTVVDNCIAATSAITSVVDSIAQGRTETGIAGGVESMSNPSVLFSERASRKFLDAATARTTGQKIRGFTKLRPGDFKPGVPGVAEPSTGLSMGEHTEITIKEWNISREAQDEIAYRSHRNAHRATEDGRLPAEISPLDGLERDLLIRPDTTMEKLAKLSPVFDRSGSGSITAGNSSPLTDGAAAVLLMSEERARRESRAPLAFIKGIEHAAIDPQDGLLMAPGVTVPRLLQKHGLSLSDIDLIEMHEAFGGQVEFNIRAWEQGWKEPAIGNVDRDKLNQLGSSIAIGHPFAATGARIVTTLANEMQRRDAKFGLVSICAAGAQASAILLEKP